jgi:hypothetical protein
LWGRELRTSIKLGSQLVAYVWKFMLYTIDLFGFLCDPHASNFERALDELPEEVEKES